jgi:hypothetical protein
MARCMIIESKLAEDWWEHARETAGYIYNRVVNAQNDIPPFTQMYGSRESLSHLRIFGSKAYPNIPLQLRESDHKNVAYEGILVGYSAEHLLSYKIYVPNLNYLIITGDVTFQEYDSDGQPYENNNDGKLIKYESKERDLSDFIYLKGSMHRDPEDGVLYVTKKVIIDKDNNIIGLRKVITNHGKELGRILYNDPIMIRDIEEMTTNYKNEMVQLAKKVLKPKVYEDTRHILESLRMIPEPGG